MRPSTFAISAAVLLSLPLVPQPLRAQQTGLNSEIKITKIDSAFVDSPRIAAPGFIKRSTGRPTPWLEIEVTFDRGAASKDQKFAEELTFNYYVLLKNEGATEDKKATMLTGSVVHVNVPSEKGMHSVVFVSPRSLSKLFDGRPPATAQQAVTDVGVTVSGKNGLLAIKSLNPSSVKGDKGWWDNAAAYTPTPGVLLNKNETPFAPLEWDFYEAIKPKAGN